MTQAVPLEGSGVGEEQGAIGRDCLGPARFDGGLDEPREVGPVGPLARLRVGVDDERPLDGVAGRELLRRLDNEVGDVQDVDLEHVGEIASLTDIAARRHAQRQGAVTTDGVMESTHHFRTGRGNDDGPQEGRCSGDRGRPGAGRLVDAVAADHAWQGSCDQRIEVVAVVRQLDAREARLDRSSDGGFRDLAARLATQRQLNGDLGRQRCGIELVEPGEFCGLAGVGGKSDHATVIRHDSGCRRVGDLVS